MRTYSPLFLSAALTLLLGASPALAVTAQVPEPSSLVLGAVGIAGASLYACLKRKR